MGNRIDASLREALFHPIRSKTAHRAAKTMLLAMALISLYYAVPECSQYFADKQLIIVDSATILSFLALGYILFAQPKKTSIASVNSSKKTPIPKINHPTKAPDVIQTAFSPPSRHDLDAETYKDLLKHRLESMQAALAKSKHLIAQDEQERATQIFELERAKREYLYQKDTFIYLKSQRSYLPPIRERLLKLKTISPGIDPEKLQLPSLEPPETHATHPSFDFTAFEISSSRLVLNPRHIAIMQMAANTPTESALRALGDEISLIEDNIANCQRQHFANLNQKYINRCVIEDLRQTATSQSFINNKLQELQTLHRAIDALINEIESLLVKIEKYNRRIPVIDNIADLFSNKQSPTSENHRQWNQKLDVLLVELAGKLSEFEEVAKREEPKPTTVIAVATNTAPASSPSKTAASVALQVSPTVAEAIDYSTRANTIVREFRNTYLPQMCDSLFNLFLGLSAQHLGRPLTTSEESYIGDLAREIRGEIKNFTNHIEFHHFFESLFSKKLRRGFIFSREHLVHLIYMAYNNRQFDKAAGLLKLLPEVDYNSQKVTLLMLYKKLYKHLSQKSAKHPLNEQELHLQGQLLSLINEVKNSSSTINFDEKLLELRGIINAAAIDDKKALLQMIPIKIPKKITKIEAWDSDERFDFSQEMGHYRGVNDHSILLQIVANEFIPMIISMLNEPDFKLQAAYILKFLNVQMSLFLRCNFSRYTADTSLEREVDYNISRNNFKEEDQRAFLQDYPGEETLRDKIFQKCIYDVNPRARIEKMKDVFLLPHPFYIFNWEADLPFPLGKIKFIEFGNKLSWKTINIITWASKAFINEEDALLIKPIYRLLAPGSDPLRKKFMSVLQSKVVTHLQTPLRDLATKPEFDHEVFFTTIINFLEAVHTELFPGQIKKSLF